MTSVRLRLLQVDVGTYSANSWQPGIRRRAVAAMVHPQYRPAEKQADKMDFDVALLLLDAPLPSTVRLVELPRHTRGWGGPGCFVAAGESWGRRAIAS